MASAGLIPIVGWGGRLLKGGSVIYKTAKGMNAADQALDVYKTTKTFSNLEKAELGIYGLTSANGLSEYITGKDMFGNELTDIQRQRSLYYSILGPALMAAIGLLVCRTRSDYVKIFEDYFSELETDMVAICLEYVDNKAEEIFIYCSYEPNMYVFDFFYRINGEIVHKHQLNEASIELKSQHNPIYDVSRERQKAALRIGNQNLKLIHEKCKEFNKEMPTEMKLHYNVKQNSLKGKYRYDLVYSNNDELLPDDIFDLWFEEMKKSNS